MIRIICVSYQVQDLYVLVYMFLPEKHMFKSLNVSTGETHG